MPCIDLLFVDSRTLVTKFFCTKIQEKITNISIIKIQTNWCSKTKSENDNNKMENDTATWAHFLLYCSFIIIIVVMFIVMSLLQCFVDKTFVIQCSHLLTYTLHAHTKNYWIFSCEKYCSARNILLEHVNGNCFFIQIFFKCFSLKNNMYTNRVI